MLILTAQPSMSLQDCINTLNENGGGTLNLNPTDVFYPTSDIILYSNITIHGNGATIDFGGGAYGFKIIGTAENYIENSSIGNVLIKNSTATGITAKYTDNYIGSFINNISVFDCDIGIDLDTCVGAYIEAYVYNNQTNCIMNNCESFEIHFASFYDSLSGDGLVLTNCSASTVVDVGFDGNAGNGVSMTNCSNIAFLSTEAIGNGGDGFQFVSDNTKLSIEGTDFSTNTGYGVNIVDNTNVGIIFLAVSTSSNGSGAINDAGTGTLKSNVVNNFI